MLKQINPEDLKEGQEYYVKLKFYFKDTGLTPYCFRDILEDDYWYHKDQPIYTLEEDQPIILTLEQTGPDPELEMLVNVASRLYSAYVTSDWAVPSQGVIARRAAELITACKQIKEGERC